tara:strand:- start:1602 stop:2666 length:1065 start_codon:yes stop_codon:yes gene_type:complete
MKKISIKDIEESLNIFRSQRILLEEMKEEIVPLIHNIIIERKINFHNVIGRVKEENSLKEKMQRYNKKFVEIKDVLGLRIITYIESDAEKICKIIENEFEINKDMSKDHSKKLGGYRGKNYIVKLNEVRKNLVENKRYKDIEFEIQITTILDHAWAEIQHDRNYKLKSLPLKFKRKFSLLAYTLELIDSQFDDLCLEIDKKINEISNKTKKGELEDIEIDSVSLRGYLNERFKDYLGKEIVTSFGLHNNDLKGVLEDLNTFGIKNLNELKNILPEWVEEYLKVQPLDAKTDYSDLIRDFLLVQFKREYCKKSILFKKSGEFVLNIKEDSLFKSKGIDYVGLCKEESILISIKDR